MSAPDPFPPLDAEIARKIVSAERLAQMLRRRGPSSPSPIPSQFLDNAAGLNTVPPGACEPNPAPPGAGPPRVVHCHGCFDLVHPGHLRYLQFARSLGDVLVVSLTGDAAVGKGADRPYIPQELRAENLAALQFVDWVVIDPHPTACELLETLRPDVYVKGREYAVSSDPRFLKEKEVVERHGGRVVFHSGDVVYSSTRLLEELEAQAELDERRLRALCGRAGIDRLRIHALLEALPRRPALVVGDVVAEQTIVCAAAGTAPDAPILDLQSVGRSESWGGAAALAFQLAALDVPTTLATTTGHDDASERLAEACRQAGVRFEPLLRDRAPAAQVTYVSDDAKLLRVTTAGGRPLDSRSERDCIARLARSVERDSTVLMSDGGHGLITPGLHAQLIIRARERSAFVAGHATGARGALAGLLDMDLVCATERRLREVMHDLEAGLPAVAWNFLRETRGSRLLVSLHKRGLIGFDAARQFSGGQPGLRPAARPKERLKGDYFPSFAPRHVDQVGLDEAVLAVAAVTLAAGGNLSQATYLAAAAAALAVQRLGRVTPSIRTLRSWLDRRPELLPQSRFVADAPRRALAPAIAGEESALGAGDARAGCPA